MGWLLGNAWFHVWDYFEREASRHARRRGNADATSGNKLVATHRRSANRGTISQPKNPEGETADGDTDAEKPKIKIEGALIYYKVANTNRKDYVVQPNTPHVTSWAELTSLSSVVHKHQTYAIRDIIYIYLSGDKDDALARICEIRDLEMAAQ